MQMSRNKYLKVTPAMCPNYNLIPAIIIGLILYYLGQHLARRVTRTGYRWLLGCLFFLLCLPGLSFILYYAHIFGEPLWYIQFRSLDYIEVLSAMWGLFFGFVFNGKPTNKYLRLQWPVFSLILIFIPFAKSYLMPPVLTGSAMKDEWNDGICIQTTGSTCGPAAMATILTYSGIPTKERDVASGSYTSAGSTEIWYIIRYARHHGMQARLMVDKDLANIPAPAILGTVSGKFGHFITLLEKSDGGFIIGDSMYGRKEFSQNEFKKRYGFNGFAVSFTKK
jgi:predicted double-glycine peptidase